MLPHNLFDERRPVLTISKKAFRNRELKKRTGKDQWLNLVSPARLQALIGMILIIIFSLEVLVPLMILNSLQSSDPTRIKRVAYSQIGVIVLSTLFFSGSFSFLTSAKRQEIFAGTAAYCAVLVVFLGNSSNVVVVQKSSAGP